MKYIEKQIEDAQTGAIANYHEVTAVNVDYVNNTVVATLASYVSKKTKDAGKSALSLNSFTLSPILPARSESAHDWSLNELIQEPSADFDPEEYPGYVNPHMFAGGKIKETDA